jgi:hypothetical protein
MLDFRQQQAQRVRQVNAGPQNHCKVVASFHSLKPTNAAATRTRAGSGTVSCNRYAGLLRPHCKHLKVAVVVGAVARGLYPCRKAQEPAISRFALCTASKKSHILLSSLKGQ